MQMLGTHTAHVNVRGTHSTCKYWWAHTAHENVKVLLIRYLSIWREALRTSKVPFVSDSLSSNCPQLLCYRNLLRHRGVSASSNRPGEPEGPGNLSGICFLKSKHRNYAEHLQGAGAVLTLSDAALSFSKWTSPGLTLEVFLELFSTSVLSLTPPLTPMLDHWQH